MKGESEQLPRGLRNRNPLNIRKSDQLWKGQIGNDGKFCIFESNEWGFRAAFRVLHTYNTKYNISSVRGIINRWAPPSDSNNTSAYINKVCQTMKVEPHYKFLIKSEDIGWQIDACNMVLAMAQVENGVNRCDISMGEIIEGYFRAFPELRNKHFSPQVYNLNPPT